MDYIQQWLQGLLSPIEPNGQPTINRAAQGQLQQLEDPTAQNDMKMQALEGLQGTAPVEGLPEETPSDAWLQEKRKREELRKREIAERMRRAAESRSSLPAAPEDTGGY